MSSGRFSAADREGSQPVAIVRCLLAIALGKLLGSALFGLVTLDALPFVIVASGLAIVSLAAACIPARRALKLDPATVLRGQ